MPVAMPALSASSSQVRFALRRLPVQSLLREAGPTAIEPMKVFTPVVIALIVPAESGVCESVL